MSTTQLLYLTIVLVFVELAAILSIALIGRARSRTSGSAYTKARTRRAIYRLSIILTLTPAITGLAMLYASS